MALIKHEKYEPCRFLRVLNPGCKPGERLRTRALKLNQIIQLFNKPLRGWIEGYLGSLNASKGWGISYKATAVYIIGPGRRNLTTGGREVKIESGDANIDDLLEGIEKEDVREQVNQYNQQGETTVDVNDIIDD